MAQSRNQPSAWAAFFDQHAVGDQVPGKVTSLVAFGAFVQIAEGVDGLIHISEIKTPLQIGDHVVVKIDSMDKTTRRISLTPSG